MREDWTRAQPPLLPETSRVSAAEELDLAGFGQRLIGRIIDYFITGLPASFIFAKTPGPGGLPRIVWFWLVLAGLSVLNDVALTTITGGTAGKLIAGTRVVHLPDLQRVKMDTAIIRWASIIVWGLLPLLGFLDDLWIFTGQLRQTLHDKIADTIVVRVGSA